MNHTVRADTGDLAAELCEVAEKLAYFLSPDVALVRRPAPGVIEIDLDPGAGDDGAAAVDRELRALLLRLSRGYRPLPVRTLFERRGPAPLLDLGGAALTARLEAEGFARRHGPGAYAFGPQLAALIEVIDDRVLQIARGAVGATLCAFPAIVSADVLHRAGYLASFPQHVSFVSHLPQRAAPIERFRAANAASPCFVLPEEAAPVAPSECLPPAVCHHRFRELSGQEIAAGSIITARGSCFRYEARSAMRDLSRLWCFQMREIVYAGDPAFVRDAAGRAARAILSLLADLDLPGACESAADPFFADVFAEKRYAQLAADRKFELRLALGRGETLAVASLNAHEDVFGRAFGIRLPGGEVAASGCAAFGLERLSLAFLAHHGLDDRAWPPLIARAVAERAG